MTPIVFRYAALVLALSLTLSACATPSPTPTPAAEPTEPTIQLTNEPTTQPSNQPTAQPTTQLPTPNLPTATLPSTPPAQAGLYENSDLGMTFEYSNMWQASPGEDETTLLWLDNRLLNVMVAVLYNPMPAGATLEEAAREIRDAVSDGVSDLSFDDDEPFTLDDGREVWMSGFSGKLSGNDPIAAVVYTLAHGGRLFTLLAFGTPEDLALAREDVQALVAGVHLTSPSVYGVPRDQALFVLGGESTNPRDYDPAHGAGDNLIFSGLVAFNPQLEIVPDLAESWDINDDGTLYTFHLRRNARFHDGRPVTAQDVIYSWERAADPATDSDSVLTYLGDIVGVREKREGQADHISGLKALDEHTLQVTLDASKPYFLMKLTFSTAHIVDRANVEAGPEWYRTPNGAGPYRLIRWDKFKLQLYERNDDFYLDPPAIRFIVAQLFAGIGLSLYETGEIDVTGVSRYDAERVRDPAEPLNADLLEGVSMCTSYVAFDVTQPPFDDVKVRQAFALAFDRQRYLDVVLLGVGLPARGLYPPALPGHNLELKGLDFDPELARQRLAESKYGGPERLPAIVFTASGYGSSVSPSVGALIDMWQTNLGISIQVENLDPNEYYDEVYDGHHGQLVSSGWCADYPDPENFADALFHSDAQQNIGHYSNPEFDALLEQARVERDVDRRIGLYQQAEQLLVEDAGAVFMNHSLNFLLVKPYVNGYVLTPIAVPIERYLSLNAEQLEK